jgi:hypothetical protein
MQFKVYHAEYGFSEEKLHHSILEGCFGAENLSSLISVKLPCHLDVIKSQVFPDKIYREVAFSTGSQVYLLNQSDKQLVDQFFVEQPEKAIRYGSLLTSDCYKGVFSLQSVKVLITDFEKENYTTSDGSSTNDCSGFISVSRCEAMEIDYHRVFQFRMAWCSHWGTSILDKSFLAKGTLRAVRGLGLNYDIVLDKSSIKGADIPCGVYNFPYLVVGNKQSSKSTTFKNSWQFNLWWSRSAIEADIIPGAIEAAQELAQLQKEPPELIRQLIQQYKKQLREDENTPINRMIHCLEADWAYQLVSHPKVVDFLSEQLQEKWKQLAFSGAHLHQAGMAQPCNQLAVNEVCIPEVPDGEDLLLFRYPIVNSDGIRRYRNTHRLTHLMEYLGCVFINPKIFAFHHQGDFDGDMAAYSLVSQLPAIASEVLVASEKGKYPPVQQMEKIAYTGSLAEQAIKQCDNNIGLVAWNIGVIEASRKPRREKLLVDLFAALQIEVDRPKSSRSSEQAFPGLMDRCNAWRKSYPVAMFEIMRNEKLFKSIGGQFPLSIDLHCLPHAINAVWEPVKWWQSPVYSFRYLFPNESVKAWSDWSVAILDAFHQGLRQISELYADDEKRRADEVGRLMGELRKQTEPMSDQQKEVAAAHLWHLQHNPRRPDGDKCSLVFNLFSEEIGGRLAEFIPEIWISGKAYNSYKEQLLNDQVAILEVGNLIEVPSKTGINHCPSILLHGKVLGVFPVECKAPKLFRGSKIVGLIQDSGNSSIKIKVSRIIPS